jgi:hypothetical protein
MGEDKSATIGCHDVKSRSISP